MKIKSNKAKTIFLTILILVTIIIATLAYSYTTWNEAKVNRFKTVYSEEYGTNLTSRKNTSDIYAGEDVINLVKDPKIIIELGGFIGIGALKTAKTYPKATIIALEPDNISYKLLCKNTRKYKNIIPVHAAIWGKDTQITLYERFGNEATDAFYTAEADNEKYFLSNKARNKIKAYSIHSLIKKFNIKKIDILTIDTEGAEENIFINDISWLDITKILFVEVHTISARKTFLKAMKSHPEFELIESRYTGEYPIYLYTFANKKYKSSHK